MYAPVENYVSWFQSDQRKCKMFIWSLLKYGVVAGTYVLRIILKCVCMFLVTAKCFKVHVSMVTINYQ